MPAIKKLIDARKRSALESSTSVKKKEAENDALPKYIGAGEIPDLPSENNTILTQNQGYIVLSDAEKAVFLITLMNFALGGKRIEKNLSPLTTNYEGKSDSSKSGPSLGNYVGYLHSFLTGTNLLKTLWINVLTRNQINEYKTWKNHLGTPPWEKMPEGEDCQTAKNLKYSYMGCLVGLSRFVLFENDGIYYAEGIQYPSHKVGWREPTIAFNEAKKGIKILWVNPEKKPWRELTALLAFINSQNSDGYDCRQIQWTLDRTRFLNNFSLWSGGLRVRGNAGDQSVKQNDDFVESEIQLTPDILGKNWFTNFKTEMEELEHLSKINYSATISYYKILKADGKKYAALASNLFWQLCERKSQELVDICNKFSEKRLKSLRLVFAGFVEKVYNTYCPKDTARQIDSWAKNRPNMAKYLL